MLIIGNGRLVTRDAGQPFFENGAVAIDGTTIKKVGTLDEIKKEFPEAEFVDARGALSCRLSLTHMSISTVRWQEA